MIKKTMNKTLIWGIGLVLFMVFQIGLPATPGPKPIKGMVIFDFTDLNSETESNPVIYSIKSESVIKEVESALREKNYTIKKIEKVLKLLENEKRYQRWYTKKNDPVQIYAFYKVKKNEQKEMVINIKEEPRKTRIVQDIELLSKLLLKKFQKKKSVEGEIYKIVGKSHRLKYTRATMTLTAKYSPKSPDTNTNQKESSKTNKNVESSIEIITGDSEHWFISADLPFKKPAELKYNETSGAIEPKEKPTEFYLGINYMIGDISSARPNPGGRFFLKGMLRFSKRPFDSFGFALGYRFPETKFLGFDLSPFSVFAGWIGTRQEEADEANNSKREFKFTFGLSFNLDKALEWMK